MNFLYRDGLHVVIFRSRLLANNFYFNSNNFFAKTHTPELEESSFNKENKK